MKPGVLTSELWILLAAIGTGESQALTANPNLNYTGMGLAALYAVCRTVLKLKGGGGGAA